MLQLGAFTCRGIPSPTVSSGWRSCSEWTGDTDVTSCRRRCCWPVTSVMGSSSITPPTDVAPCDVKARPSCRDIGIRHPDVLHALGVGGLVFERAVVALEHGDEQGQRQERVRAHLEQSDVVVFAKRSALGLCEGQPAGLLGGDAVEQLPGPLGLPPVDGGCGVGAVALNEFGVAVDGVEELVEQVFAHRATFVSVAAAAEVAGGCGVPLGYQVK